MSKTGKQFVAAREKVEDKFYLIEEAVPLLQSLKFAKFDETVEMTMRLGVDPKHADQMVRGAIVLPHGIGKSVRVLVFAKGDKENEARERNTGVVGRFLEHLTVLLAAQRARRSGGGDRKFEYKYRCLARFHADSFSFVPQFIAEAEVAFA